MSGCRRVCVAVLAASIAAAPAHAQLLRGRVLDESTRAPVPDVTIRVQSAAAAMPVALSDSGGVFQVTLAGPGTYTLTTSRIGYADVGPLPFSVRRDEQVDVIVRIGTAAVPLTPLEVAARTIAGSTMQNVQARMEAVRRSGIGRVLTREDIERRAPVAAASIVSALSPRLTGQAGIRDENTIVLTSGAPHGDCFPAVFVDGFRINASAPGNVNRYLSPQDIEAVEVYIGQGEMPMQYRDPDNCAVVLFWSRRGRPEDTTVLTWKRALVGVIVASAILLLQVAR